MAAVTLLMTLFKAAVLAPLLFVLYSNDVVNMFNNAIESKLYADDLKLYSEIVAETEYLIQQHGLDDFVCLSNKWQLIISLKNTFPCK